MIDPGTLIKIARRPGFDKDVLVLSYPLLGSRPVGKLKVDESKVYMCVGILKRESGTHPIFMQIIDGELVGWIKTYGLLFSPVDCDVTLEP